MHDTFSNFSCIGCCIFVFGHGVQKGVFQCRHLGHSGGVEVLFSSMWLIMVVILTCTLQLPILILSAIRICAQICTTYCVPIYPPFHSITLQLFRRITCHVPCEHNILQLQLRLKQNLARAALRSPVSDIFHAIVYTYVSTLPEFTLIHGIAVSMYP